eukprot:891613_1
MDNCIRGFQGYVHLCGDVTATLDYNNNNNGQWCLNKQYMNGLFNELKKERDRINDNMRLLHGNSNCSILVFIKCQPLFTNLRDNENAVNTMIEFEGNDFEMIMNILDIKNKWPIKVIGIPWWSNVEYLRG